MRFDRAIIEIRPRGVFELLDLAVLFYRSQLGLIVKLSLLFGLPALGLGFGTAALAGSAWLGALVFFLLLPLASGAIIMAASRLVFSIPMTVGRTYSLYRSMMTRHFFLRLGHRLLWLPLLPLLAGEALRLRWAFTPMIILLERLAGPPLRIRRASLYRRGGANALGLDLALSSLVAAVTVAMVFVADLVLSDMVSMWRTGGIFEGLDDEPLKIGIWMLAYLLAMPIAELTWFFFYLNARIRKEGWDIELGFRVAAEKVKASRKEAA